MKVLVSFRCQECNKMMIAEIEEKELAIKRELDEWIVKELTICKRCAKKLLDTPK